MHSGNADQAFHDGRDAPDQTETLARRASPASRASRSRRADDHLLQAASSKPADARGRRGASWIRRIASTPSRPRRRTRLAEILIEVEALTARCASAADRQLTMSCDLALSSGVHAAAARRSTAISSALRMK